METKKDPSLDDGSPCGAQTRNRTRDTGIFSPLLYLLSYLSVWWAILGSNQGPTGYEPVALTSELMAHSEKVVGVAGFEPAAHWSQTSCATKLRYTPTCTY